MKVFKAFIFWGGTNFRGTFLPFLGPFLPFQHLYGNFSCIICPRTIKHIPMEVLGPREGSQNIYFLEEPILRGHFCHFCGPFFTILPLYRNFSLHCTSQNNETYTNGILRPQGRSLKHLFWGDQLQGHIFAIFFSPFCISPGILPAMYVLEKRNIYQ